MCCDGTMFHHVRLQPRDSAKALAALGLKLKRKRKHDHIIQPCPAYRGSQCSIYLDRPERCRLFECRQIRRVAAGEITEAAAAEKIRDALKRSAHIHGLFARLGETNSKGPLTTRYEKVIAEPLDPVTEADAIALRAELQQAMEEFEALLESDFRVQ
jgi:Fe-S-cluster containining protein